LNRKIQSGVLSVLPAQKLLETVNVNKVRPVSRVTMSVDGVDATITACDLAITMTGGEELEKHLVLNQLII